MASGWDHFENLSLISATLFYQVSSHKHLDPAVRMRHLGYTNGGTSGSVFPGGPLGAENASTHEWVIGHPFICYEGHATRFLHPESRRAHSLFPRVSHSRRSIGRILVHRLLTLLLCGQLHRVL